MSLLTYLGHLRNQVTGYCQRSNLSIDRARGVAFALGRNYATDPENPSTVSDSAQTAANTDTTETEVMALY